MYQASWVLSQPECGVRATSGKGLGQAGGAAHITLQLVGPLCVLQAQLLRVAGGLGQGLPVAHVTGQLLAPLGLEEAGLVWAAVEPGAILRKVLLVLIVTLELADAEEMPHPRVVVDAAVPDLQAPVPQEGLFVPKLQVRGAEMGHWYPPLLTNSQQDFYSGSRAQLWIQVDLPLYGPLLSSSYVALGQLLSLSEPQFPHLIKMGEWP